MLTISRRERASLDNDGSPDQLALDSVSSVERSDQEERHGQTESQQGQEDVGEVGYGEYCHGGDIQGLYHPGSVHQDGEDGQAGVEDDEG